MLPNTKALQMAGINKETKAPAEGNNKKMKNW